MDQKDRVDSYLKLAEFAAGRWDARKQFEWRVTLGVWAVLVAAILYFRADTLPVWLGLAILVVYGNWLQNIWRRHSSDANLAWQDFHSAREEIECSTSQQLQAENETIAKLRIGKGSHTPGVAKVFGFLSDWSLRFQFLCTMGLLTFVYVFCANHITWFRLIAITAQNRH